MEIEPLRFACGGPTEITEANLDGATSTANADNFLNNQSIKIRFLAAPLLALADSHSDKRPVIAGRYHRVLSANLRRAFVSAPKLYRLAFATACHHSQPH